MEPHELEYEIEIALARKLIQADEEPTIRTQIHFLEFFYKQEMEIVWAMKAMPKQNLRTENEAEAAMLKAIHIKRLLARLRKEIN